MRSGTRCFAPVFFIAERAKYEIPLIQGEALLSAAITLEIPGVFVGGPLDGEKPLDHLLANDVMPLTEGMFEETALIMLPEIEFEGGGDNVCVICGGVWGRSLSSQLSWLMAQAVGGSGLVVNVATDWKDGAGSTDSVAADCATWSPRDARRTMSVTSGRRRGSVSRHSAIRVCRLLE